jgi:hypothetical protein
MTSISVPAPVHRFEAAGLGKAPFTFVDFQVMKFQACQGAPIQCGTSCDFCGAGIMNVFRVRSSDGRQFKVGPDCIAKVGDAGLMQAVKRVRAQRRQAGIVERRAAARRTRETAARARRQRTRVEACEFARANGLASALLRAACKGRQAQAARGLLDKLTTFGALSPAQLAFLKSLGTKSAPAPSGSVTFDAEIESVKARGGDYGMQYKMTVRADAGFRAWMTCPRSLLDSPGIGLDRFRGLRVTIKATLEPSDEDPSFAFGKRPKVTVR